MNYVQSSIDQCFLMSNWRPTTDRLIPEQRSIGKGQKVGLRFLSEIRVCELGI